MKRYRYTFLIILTSILPLLQACEPQGPSFEISRGLSFRVTGIESELTKSVQDEDPGALIPLSGDLVTATGDTLRMRMQETSLGMVGSGNPVTKASPFSGTDFPNDKKFALTARSYQTKGGGTASEWAVYPVGKEMVGVAHDGSRHHPSSTWVPTPRVLWPGGSGFLRFYAYAPFTDENGNGVDDLAEGTSPAIKLSGNGEFPSLTFTVPATIDDQIDLLVANTTEYDADPDIDDIDVPLTFKHALTGIRFRVGNGLDLESVEIKDIKNEGKIDLRNVSSGFTWQDLSATPSVASYKWVLSGQSAMIADSQKTGYIITDEAYTFFLLPQTIPAGATIEAKVKTQAGGISHTVTADIAGQTWYPGKMITYTLTDSDVTYFIELIDPDTGKAFDLEINQEMENYQQPISRLINVRSYSSVNIGGVSKSFQEEPWTVYYSIDGGIVWRTKDEWDHYYTASGKYGWSELQIKNPNYDPGVAGSEEWESSLNGNGSRPADAIEERRLLIDQNLFEDLPTVSVRVRPDLIGPMRGLREVDSDAAPRDLSMYDIYGQPNTSSTLSRVRAGRHTANCYVVNAPGWYCFPLVYGNALDATIGSATGGINAAAYGNSAFLDAKGNVINSPYILPADANLENYDAVVIWEDVVKGYEVIKNEDVSLVSGVSLGSRYDQNCIYLKFHLKPGDPNIINQDAHPGYKEGGILPCNIMIGLREKNNASYVDEYTQDEGGTALPGILWSWHLWVMPSGNFGVSPLQYNNTETGTTETVQLLNCILGWTPPLYFYAGHVKPSHREALIRFCIGDPYAPKAEKTIKIVQNGRSTPNDVDGGDLYNGTYYQWGRKDPLLSGLRNLNTGARTNRPSSSPSGYRIEAKSTTPDYLLKLHTEPENAGTASEVLVGKESRYPYIYATHYEKRHTGIQIASNNTSDIFPNDVFYWNINGDAGRGTAASLKAENHTVKTIYDPCPPGFCIPFYNAFNRLICQASTEESVTAGNAEADGWRFDPTGTGTGTKDMFFPYTGWRSNLNMGKFSYGIGSTNYGEGIWVSSLCNDFYSVREYQTWPRVPVFFRMSVAETRMENNHLSRGNVIRPIIEEVPSGN